MKDVKSSTQGGDRVPFCSRFTACVRSGASRFQEAREICPVTSKQEQRETGITAPFVSNSRFCSRPQRAGLTL
jgi:hypothetical protein